MASPSFGTRLKAEREGRGFTLVQIADSTKIPVALLQGLERNDLSRWPKGLYRRAFFRSYVTALGLRAEPLVLEFARLFPDDVDAVANPNECSPAETEAADVPPLALSWAGPPAKRHVLHSGVIALTEALALELAQDQILVNAIAPGPILAPPGTSDKELEDVAAATPVGRWGGEESIVHAVSFLLETEFVTGETIRVDGGRHVK